MALIFFFSSQTREESATVSRGILGEIVEVIIKISGDYEREKENLVYLLHDFIRTAAHFTIFSLLGISSAVMFLTNLKIRGKKLLLTVFMFCLFYACSDEIHQIFVPGRAFQFSDIIVDAIGSATGIIVIVFLRNIFKLKMERS